jgi:hypothetical protein
MASVFQLEDSALARYLWIISYASVVQSSVDFWLLGVPMLLAASSALKPVAARGVFTPSKVVSMAAL